MSHSTWKALSVGLTWSYAGICLAVASVVLAALSALAIPWLGPDPGDARGRSLLLLALVMTLAALTGQALDLLGRVRCLVVPASFPGRGWLVGAILIQAVCLGWNLATLVGPRVTSWSGQPPLWLGSLIQILAAISPLALLTFLAALARALNRHDLCTHALATQTAGLTLALIYIVLALAAPVVPPAYAPWFLLTNLLLLVVALGVFVRYANLLTYLRRAIREHLDRPDPGDAADWHSPDTLAVKRAVQGDHPELMT